MEHKDVDLLYIFWRNKVGLVFVSPKLPFVCRIASSTWTGK